VPEQDTDQSTTGFVATAHTMLSEHTNAHRALDLRNPRKNDPGQDWSGIGKRTSAPFGAPAREDRWNLLKIWQNHRINHVNHPVGLKKIGDGYG
jgi:hypothetical protein